MEYTFLYISLLLKMHDYNVKMPYVTFYGGFKKGRRHFPTPYEHEYGLQDLNYRRVRLHLTK